MKKQILTTLCIASLSIGAFAQGTLNFGNSGTTLVSLISNTGANTGAIGAAGGTFTFEIFRAPAGTATDTGFIATGVQGTNLVSAGRLNGGNGRVIPGTSLGGTAALLVRGWSTSLGADYATALAAWPGSAGLGYIGSSAIAPNFLLGGDGGAGPIPNSPIFGASAFQLTTGFSLTQSLVPEPSSMVLAGLGAASLLMFRRKN